MSDGNVEFPGIGRVVDVSFDDVQGPSPSVAVLTIDPQTSLPATVGDLTLIYRDTRRTLKDCRVDRSRFQFNARGQLLQLAIFDRRWKWAFGEIFGTWNVRRPDGTIEPETEKTPQELAALCFAAAGEADTHVGDLPNELRPEVKWAGRPPMLALADMADGLGCRIVLQRDNSVAIRKVGVGEQLPTTTREPGTGLMAASTAQKLATLPKRIAVRCGEDLFQVDFALEAVGLDVDGVTRPIGELLLQPEGGWVAVDLPEMFTVYDEHVVELGAARAAAQQEMAAATVFRWYRILLPKPGQGEYILPGSGVSIRSMHQLTPIGTEQVETHRVLDANGRVSEQPWPAWVYGSWYSKAAVGPSANSTENVTPLKFGSGSTRVRVPFTIDTERGIVVFSQPVYRNMTPTTDEVVQGPAVLRLRTAVRVRTPVADGLKPQHYRKVRALGNQPTGTKFLSHPELVRTHVPVLTDAFVPTDDTTNQLKIDAACEHYLDAEEAALRAHEPQTVSYVGILPLELDGAIQHASIKIGPPGTPTTSMYSRNTEMLDRVIPYDERRRIEKARL